LRFIFFVLQAKYFRVQILRKTSETVFEAVQAVQGSHNIIRFDNIQSFDMFFPNCEAE